MNFLDLAEECISAVISFTSPTTPAVSLLSPNCSASPWILIPFGRDFFPQILVCISINLYLDFPITSCSSVSANLLFSSTMEERFWMDKRSAKKCWMLSARKLDIIWVDSLEFWIWISIPDSRSINFISIVRGSCRASNGMLVRNPRKNKHIPSLQSNHSLLLEVSFFSTRTEVYNDRRVFLKQGMQRCREDGWLEIGVGEYYVGSDDEELEMSVLETIEGGWKGGIIVQGIEIRPKEVLGLGNTFSK
ncbi:hypothetical protein ARALYDRAFT_326746 [Arabidopsis lyrata subsp. lyrata]|uniref:F-box family protein n=1 Tax=Arabidopsis lyrata subsp. lyrata TaxID=81972 RepID=D7M362_ARALL|nr:hypothetical protein ARALYDRAFT_326746 [Arabidopsis lyrata subsp. lyrata]